MTVTTSSARGTRAPVRTTSSPTARVRWVGLTVLDVVDGGEDDAEGVVEFRAEWVSDDDGPVRRGEVDERSRFVRRGGRWVYLDAE